MALFHISHKQTNTHSVRYKVGDSHTYGAYTRLTTHFGIYSSLKTVYWEGDESNVTKLQRHFPATKGNLNKQAEKIKRNGAMF